MRSKLKKMFTPPTGTWRGVVLEEKGKGREC